MWRALSDERTGLSFNISDGPRQHSHSRVRFPRDSWPYVTASNSRLPQPEGPGVRIYVPQEQGGPVRPPGTGFPFRHLRLQGYGGGIRTHLHTGTNSAQSESQSYSTTGGLSPINSSRRPAPWESRPEFFFLQLNTCIHSPYVTSSLTRGRVCLLRIGFPFFKRTQCQS
jgi:hypothetical protein